MQPTASSSAAAKLSTRANTTIGSRTASGGAESASSIPRDTIPSGISPGRRTTNTTTRRKTTKTTRQATGARPGDLASEEATVVGTTTGTKSRRRSKYSCCRCVGRCTTKRRSCRTRRTCSISLTTCPLGASLSNLAVRLCCLANLRRLPALFPGLTASLSRIGIAGACRIPSSVARSRRRVRSRWRGMRRDGRPRVRTSRRRAEWCVG
jgi:hypothetical protein